MATYNKILIQLQNVTDFELKLIISDCWPCGWEQGPSAQVRPMTSNTSYFALVAGKNEAKLEYADTNADMKVNVSVWEEIVGEKRDSTMGINFSSHSGAFRCVSESVDDGKTKRISIIVIPTVPEEH